MEVEKDFIKREIQKLLLLLIHLIGRTGKINSNNVRNEIENINEALKNAFDLSFVRMAKMENSKFIEHISKLHESHIDKILKLIYEIILKIPPESLGEKFEKTKIILKGIIIIDFIDEKSKTFSIERKNMKCFFKQSI